MDAPSSLSDLELIARCSRDEDPTVWVEFTGRFHRRIARYVLRERRSYGRQPAAEEAETVHDLTQEVYVRLLANDRRALREFRGETEFAVYTYFARVVRTVVGDRVRREGTLKRSAYLVPLDAVHQDAEKGEGPKVANLLAAGDESAPDRELAERLVVERVRDMIVSSPVATNGPRDAVIFLLHVLEGLSSREIASMPRFGMTSMAVEAVIRRTRSRLRSAIKDPTDLSV